MKCKSKPILNYLVNEKFPEVAQVDDLARSYGSKNSSKNSIYPDGLE